jgi:hypothetical protein
LNELNRHLSEREFHRRDYYRFKATETGTHADLIELVRQSRRPDFQFSLFGKDDVEPADNPVMRAKRRIESILSNRESKTEEIEDPRQYFNFELFIHDKEGKVRSSLSSRTGTGSGGSVAVLYRHWRVASSDLPEQAHKRDWACAGDLR